MSILLGYDNGSFARRRTYATGSFPYSIAAGDFNQDIYLDTVVVNSNSNNPAGDQPRLIAIDDFNNDTLLDIVVANYGSHNLGVFLGHGDGTFAEMIVVSLEYGSRPFSVLVGDFNIDRKLDFAVANDGTDDLSILLQTC